MRRALWRSSWIRVCLDLRHRAAPIHRLREWVVWFGPGRLAATALAVIAVVAGGTWLLKDSPSRAEDQLPFASRTTPTATATAGTPVALPSTTVPSEIVVYVVAL